MPKAVALAVGEMPLSLPAPICHNLASPKPASMEMITTEDYILYGFLAFIALLLVSIVVGMFRQFRDTGEIKGRMEGMQRQIDEMKIDLSGRIEGLSGRIDSLSGRIDGLSERIEGQSGRIDSLSERIEGQSGRIDSLSERIEGQSGRIDSLSGRLERLEQTVASLAGEVGEIKGLLLALHQRVDLVMRHRHDADTGQVILTPEAVAAD